MMHAAELDQGIVTAGQDDASLIRPVEVFHVDVAAEKLDEIALLAIDAVAGPTLAFDAVHGHVVGGVGGDADLNRINAVVRIEYHGLARIVRERDAVARSSIGRDFQYRDVRRPGGKICSAADVDGGAGGDGVMGFLRRGPRIPDAPVPRRVVASRGDVEALPDSAAAARTAGGLNGRAG